MSFLHSEQPKCNQICPPCPMSKRHFSTFSAFPTRTLKGGEESAPSFTAHPLPLECPPNQVCNVPLFSRCKWHHSHSVSRRISLAWLVCPMQAPARLPRADLRAWQRLQDSGNRPKKGDYCPPSSLPQLAAESSISKPKRMFHTRETSSRSPPLPSVCTLG